MRTPAAVAALVALASTAGFAQQAAAPAQVPYPDGYRAWQHVKSMVILPGHPLAEPFGGVHHIYANRQAIEGLRTGRYADGSVLVFDLLQAMARDSAVTEGPRKLVGVMWRDGARHAATGGWGFEGFAGDSRTERLVSDGGRGCFACHEARAGQGYVFSELRP